MDAENIIKHKYNTCKREIRQEHSHMEKWAWEQRRSRETEAKRGVAKQMNVEERISIYLK